MYLGDTKLEILVPTDLKLKVPEVHIKYQDYYLYLLSLISSRQIAYGEFAPLNSSQLRNLFPNRTLYFDVKRILLEQKIIECDGTYIQGKKSLGYRLAFEPKAYAKMAVTNKFLLKKIQKQSFDSCDLISFIKSNLKEIEVNYKFNEIVTSVEVPLWMIKSKNIYAKRDAYGRLHSNVTNLKSSLRRYLTYKQNNLVNIDIRNSQPLMLGVLYRKLFKINKISSFSPSPTYVVHFLDDWEHYISLCEKGEFYEFIMNKINLPLNERKKFKAEFFKNIFFCRNEDAKESYISLFQKYFPSVMDFIYRIKAKDYTLLAKMLQEAESTIIIDRVLTALSKSQTFVSTIHDSFLTIKQNVAHILDVINEEFKQIEISPSLKIEDCA